jgi:hypothetical protein
VRDKVRARIEISSGALSASLFANHVELLGPGAIGRIRHLVHILAHMLDLDSAVFGRSLLDEVLAVFLYETDVKKPLATAL